MLFRVTNILHSQSLWCDNQHDKSLVARSIPSQPTNASLISQPLQENHLYEDSIEESDHSSFKDEESIEESDHNLFEAKESKVKVDPQDQMNQTVLEIYQPEDQDIIPCQHPNSILEQDIQNKTEQQDNHFQEEQKEIMTQANIGTTEEEIPQNFDTTEQELTQMSDAKEQEYSVQSIITKEEGDDNDDPSVKAVPNDKGKARGLTIDTSICKVPFSRTEESDSLSSGYSTSPPKTPPSSSSFFNKPKITTTSLFKREATKFNDRRKSLSKKIKSALHPKHARKFSV